MEKMNLSQAERIVLRVLSSGKYDGHFLTDFSGAIRTLEAKGLVRAFLEEGHGLVDARITQRGKFYLADNPRLRNPVVWKWVLVTAIAVAGVILGTISCSGVIK